MTKKEIEKYFDNATQGSGVGHKGKRFVTHEMMEKDSIGTLIKETKPKDSAQRIIVGISERHILRRKIA